MSGYPKCNLAVDEALDNTLGVRSPMNPDSGEGYSPTAWQWVDSANDDFFNAQGWSDAFNSDDIQPIRGDIMTDGGHMGVYTGNGNITSAPTGDPVRTVPATIDNYYFRRWMGDGG